MPASFPGSVPNLTNPTTTDKTNSVTVPHATQHANANDEIEALATKLGTGSSTASANTVLRGTGSGVTSFGAIDHNYLSNRTRSVFIPATAMAAYTGSPGAPSTTNNRFGQMYWSLSASADEAVSGSFWMPKDYASGAVAAKILWGTPDANAGNVYVDIGARLRAADEVIDLQYVGTQAIAAPGDAVETVNVTTITGDLFTADTEAADKLAQIIVRRQGSHASDTYGSVMHLFGVVLEYTADM